MGEYDCITVPIERQEAMALGSAGCQEDFELESQPGVLQGAYGRLKKGAILALATSSVALGGFEHVDVTTTFPTAVAVRQIASKHGRRISLAEARRIAQDLQRRIDAEYEELLERDAATAAVWEEDS